MNKISAIGIELAIVLALVGTFLSPMWAGKTTTTGSQATSFSIAAKAH